MPISFSTGYRRRKFFIWPVCTRCHCAIPKTSFILFKKLFEKWTTHTQYKLKRIYLVSLGISSQQKYYQSMFDLWNMFISTLWAFILKGGFLLFGQIGTALHFPRSVFPMPSSILHSEIPSILPRSSLLRLSISFLVVCVLSTSSKSIM